MASERDVFELSGPLHLTSVDWTDVDHRRSVAACMVQGVYIMQRDRQENRHGSQALAPSWWKFSNFDLQSQLIDDADSSIFGAIYKYKPDPLPNYTVSTNSIPSYIVAFRGTITKGDAFSRDLELDLHFVKNVLHQSSRFEIANQAVRNLVASGNQNIWLTGHSLGAAMAMLAGKNMAKNRVFLESHLFNPPFVSAPIETIKNKKVKHGLRIAGSFVTAGLAVAVKMKNNHHQRNNEFLELAEWVPCLYVNPRDHICSEYIGYFGHRVKMGNIGAGGVERLAAQHSIAGLFMDAIGKESHEPLHLIPSANLTVNLKRARDLKEAHGIHQWWRRDQQLESRTYR
ncbi:GDSL esterase/lipase At4g10955-like [Rutidosis leptorrhynchoides]|uniref:GDSL esterase/lipase At4g10955-like n=1 Tax=Rutidosis leptorrhynchoides TaxID=125765 RepID=UPI003A98F940